MHLEIDPATDPLDQQRWPPARHAVFGSAQYMGSPAGRTRPALGLIDGIPFPRMEGEVHTGDALILYTDGIVETRTELLDGIDWMGGVAERACKVGFEGFAAYLVRRGARRGRRRPRALVVWKPTTPTTGVP